jgi:AraC-like DNA-binding protein
MQQMRPIGHPGLPDEEPTLIRAVLDGVLQALPPKAVVLAHGVAAPPERATITGSPRLVLALGGRNVMAVPRGDRIERVSLTGGELVVVTEQCWNMPLHLHALRFLTLDFKREFTRYYCRDIPGAGRGRGSYCIHLRLEPPTPAIRHAWQAIEALGGQPDAAASIGNFAVAILREATRAVHRAPPATSQGLAAWRRLCDHIDDHLHEELGREELARRCGLHPNHVSRLFRQQGGERFTDYLSRRRLERAASMLRSYDMPIHAIAASCGYRDQAYFANAFRRRYGCSPTTWRRTEGR